MSMNLSVTPEQKINPLADFYYFVIVRTTTSAGLTVWQRRGYNFCAIFLHLRRKQKTLTLKAAAAASVATHSAFSCSLNKFECEYDLLVTSHSMGRRLERLLLQGCLQDDL